MRTCDPSIWGWATAVIQIVAAILLDSIAVERTASDAPDQIRLAHGLAVLTFTCRHACPACTPPMASQPLSAFTKQLPNMRQATSSLSQIREHSAVYNHRLVRLEPAVQAVQDL